jgi:hypothetical protein
MALLDTFREALDRGIRRTFKNTEEEISRLVGHHVRRARNYLVTQIIFFSITAFALVLLVLAALFAGIEYLHLGATLSFLITGIILLLVALIIKIAS